MLVCRQVSARFHVGVVEVEVQVVRLDHQRQLDRIDGRRELPEGVENVAADVLDALNALGRGLRRRPSDRIFSSRDSGGIFLPSGPGLARTSGNSRPAKGTGSWCVSRMGRHPTGTAMRSASVRRESGSMPRAVPRPPPDRPIGCSSAEQGRILRRRAIGRSHSTGEAAAQTDETCSNSPDCSRTPARRTGSSLVPLVHETALEIRLNRERMRNGG